MIKSESECMIQARACLESAKNPDASLEDLRDLSVRLASLMLEEGNRIQSWKEKKRQQQLAGMIEDPKGKIFTASMADQCFRSRSSARVADQLIYLLRKFGIPQYLPFFKKLQLKSLMWIVRPLASVIIPIVTWVLRKETSTVILPGEPSALAHHLRRRHQEGIRMNLNHLGEAILGEKEAKDRLNIYLEDLANPDVEYVSIKISTIYSQINLLAREATLEILADRLRQLYRAAMTHTYRFADGRTVQKFVNLDMEEYRDLHMTVDLFRKVLDEEEFKTFSAGIVLQAYLPDSYEIQKSLTAWAIDRCARGGAPIKIRIVKGANLAMEAFEASLRGWPQAPYREKVDVDANYKRMLLFGMEKLHAQAVYLGIGSHNLLDIAFALLLRARHRVEEEVCFEMLEGMASHLTRVVQKLSGGMLLYCPAAKRHEFQNAVAYLIRRLDENTAKENFLRHSFQLKVGSAAWNQQVELFKQAFNRIASVRSIPYRRQNRLELPVCPLESSPFQNEPDTDFSLPSNQEWARLLVKQWMHKVHAPIPLVIAGQSILFEQDAKTKEGIGVDPSYPDKPLYRYTMASEIHVEMALQTAEEACRPEKAIPFYELSIWMAQVAQKMREARADLIGAMMADGGKTIIEADIEVSEAIDMAEYYRRCRAELASHSDLQWSPKGIAVVIPPWNFPCAIPAGGIIAALMAGNSVIFKPSRETILIAWILVNLFWEAGVPKTLLQFLTGSSEVIGNKLIQDPRVKVVILTGSTETGQKMLRSRPALHLMAETGGKNAMILTQLADRDLAIKEIVHSAFGHAGQKCSAASLLILDKEIYDDFHFREQLRDAAESLKVGIPWDLSNKVGPLIHAPNPELLRGLTTLEEGEFWLLEPKQDSRYPNVWSPGIKWGVKEGSFCYKTELFGPVLSVMRAENLKEALRFANGTRYGLTSGLQTLDEREIPIWLEAIEAGNCYINRSITGAIVRRQPFGGYKASCIGPGSKAGGPNYLVHLMEVRQITSPNERASKSALLRPLEPFLKKRRVELSLWEQSVESYAFWWERYRKDEDPSKVIGEDNFLKYVPHKGMVLRLTGEDDLLHVAMVCAAAVTCGVSLQISCESQVKGSSVFKEWPVLPGIVWIEEKEVELIHRIQKNQVRRIRMLSTPSSALLNAAAELLCYIAHAEPLANGRVELLHYLREIAISIDYHRYGNLGEREGLTHG